ncbi:helix-turn-helix transcriptional regulator [Oricola nitratireducens]|uniref:helix-turn-helix transcriptional regulator n=1 Tax=Oricola nitratireducens TaxID=2775868 RepID=UPI001FEF17E2|nr:AraC family transcriptional regulator [Oricola nitratireducens]
MRLSFGAGWAGLAQPLIAVLVAPSAYLGFRALSQDTSASWREALIWNGVPVVFAQLAILAPIPVSADVFVLAITGVYLFRIATLLRYHADDFVQVTPDAMRIVRLAIYATMVLLAMMVATDGLIVAASLFAREPFVLNFLTGVSGVFAAFIFIVALVGGPIVLYPPGSAGNKTEAPSDRDRALMQALDALMTEKQLYKDNNLTLARVARRLSVPVREVSAATNRTTGENFSRYMNAYRIRHAQRVLRETDLSITEVMFDAGFISKSSFNTEFRRIVGQTPSQYRMKTADA